jgi:hypothetical protein
MVKRARKYRQKQKQAQNQTQHVVINNITQPKVQRRRYTKKSATYSAKPSINNSAFDNTIRFTPHPAYQTQDITPVNNELLRIGDKMNNYQQGVLHLTNLMNNYQTGMIGLGDTMKNIESKTNDNNANFTEVNKYLDNYDKKFENMYDTIHDAKQQVVPILNTIQHKIRGLETPIITTETSAQYDSPKLSDIDSIFGEFQKPDTHDEQLYWQGDPTESASAQEPVSSTSAAAQEPVAEAEAEEEQFEDIDISKKPSKPYTKQWYIDEINKFKAKDIKKYGDLTKYKKDDLKGYLSLIKQDKGILPKKISMVRKPKST